MFPRLGGDHTGENQPRNLFISSLKEPPEREGSQKQESMP